MPVDLLAPLLADDALGPWWSWLDEGGPFSARGAVGSSTGFLAAAVRRRTGRPVLLVTAHLDEADERVDECESLNVPAARLAAMEALPGETGMNLELLAERLRLVRRLRSGEDVGIIVAPIQALMQGVPDDEALDAMLRVIRPGDRVDVTAMASWLDQAGYARVPAIESPGEFAIRGGILDVFAPGGQPCRIDLFGDEVEHLFEIDLDTMGSDRRLEQVEIVGATPARLRADGTSLCLPALLPRTTVGILAELMEITEQGRSYFDRAIDATGIFGPPAVFKAIREHASSVVDVNHVGSGAHPERVLALPVRPLPAFAEETPAAVHELAEMSAEARIIVCGQNDGEVQRMRELFSEHGGGAGAVEITDAYVHRGFTWGETGRGTGRATTFVPYHELLHRYHARRRGRRLAGGRAMDQFVEMQVGDYVVHQEHGIARFVGLQAMKGAGSKAGAEEFLSLEFSAGAKLHVPVSKIEMVRKYVGSSTGRPQLSTLGGRRWKHQKDKVGEAVRDLAADMLRMQAARASMPGIAYPADTPWQREFEAAFPYEETEDQLSAIASIKRDMMHARPMDRLVCGDVGFGKTEVAIRAAFKAVEYGRQVAVLVPTTVLAEQHQRTFHERFADYPFKVESISRFKTKAEQNAVLREVRAGRIDIIIGTHRLLSKDVGFADLGLVIVDEEQRFGVEHKQRLLEFRLTADVLTLSATPIPRTLHMAMLGLRDISSLTTPPADRRAIVTEVLHYNRKRVRQALERELAREGQIYFVHNRVHNIESVADEIQQLAPEAKVIVGHGQMPPRQLEKVMLRFMRRQADVLVCTTIIESGIDIPTANTMFINNANHFGLAELHQLRGRVGRYKHRAYCYLLLPDDQVLSEIATKRMQAIENHSMLGAGFKIALRDLEIRGAGNLLGAEQSGHIAAIGYDLYCQMLEDAVSDLRQDRRRKPHETVFDIGVTGTIPRGYIPSDLRRMEAYRRVSQAHTTEALAQVERDIVSAYGDLPAGARTLFDIAELRVLASMLDIRSLSRHDDDLIFLTPRPRDLEICMDGVQGSLRMVGTPDEDGFTTVYYRPPKAFLEPGTLITVLRRRLARAAPAEAPAGSPR